MYKNFYALLTSYYALLTVYYAIVVGVYYFILLLSDFVSWGATEHFISFDSNYLGSERV